MCALPVAVIGPKRQLALHRTGTVLPEFLDRLVVNALVAFVMDDPSQLAILEPVTERFESGHFCDHLFGHVSAPAGGDHLRLVRQEPEHALLLEAPRESTHRIRVEVRFLGPLGGSGVCKEDQGADHFIAPLDMIDKVQLELSKIPQWFHQCVSLRPAWRPAGRLIPRHRDLKAREEVVAVGCWEVPGTLELVESPIVGGEEENRDGDTASIAAAEADPEVVMGR